MSESSTINGLSGSDRGIVAGIVRHRYAMLLLVCFGIVTLMTYWTPMFSDDWHYGFIYEKEGKLMQRPIQTVSDLIESLHNYYLYKDGGRCVANGTAMVFLAFLGHKAFAVCNGVMFTLLLHLFCLNFAGKRENYFTMASVVLTSVVILLPRFELACLWLDGSCNYLWCAVLILLFNYLLNRDIKKRWWPLLFVYGIIAGDTNEGIMIGLSVGYAVYYLSHFRLLTAQRWVMLIGLAVGVAILVFSPGVWHRATVQGTTGGTSSLFSEGPRFLLTHIPQYLMSLRLTYVAVFLMVYRKKFPLLWGTAMIPLALLCLVVEAGAATSYFGLELCSLIVVLQLLNVERIKSKYVTMMAVLPIVTMLVALPLCARDYTTFVRIDRMIKESNDKTVILYDDAKSIALPYLSDRFLLNPWKFNPFRREMPPEQYRYYRKDDIRVFPTRVREDILRGKVGKEFDLHTTRSYYICEWNGTDTVEGKILYNPSEYAKYPVLNRLGRFTLTEQSIEDSYIVLPPINGKRYLLIEKNKPIADRIRGIEVYSKE